MHYALGSIPALHKPGVAEHACYHNTWEVEAGG